MTTDKRARQKANRANRVAAAEAAAARARMRSRITTYGGLAVLVVVAIVAISILTSDDDPETVDPGTTSAPITNPTTAPPVIEPGVSAPAPGGTIDGETPCPAEDGSAERITSFAAAPPMCIDETAAYTATLDTTLGEFTIELDAAAAPITVNNFVVLARYHYYDEVAFHRIVPNFVIQGGDAVGDPLGTGGPGYSIVDELPEEGEYEVGSVAMANSSAPDTGGSQFFVVTGDQGVALPPLYSLFGTVTDGLDVVLDIEASETTVGDAPVDSIIINSIVITEG